MAIGDGSHGKAPALGVCALAAGTLIFSPVRAGGAALPVAGTPWIASDGATTVVGAGRRITLHLEGMAAPVEILLDTPSSSGVVLGGGLVIMSDQGQMLRLDLDAPASGARPLGAPIAGRRPLMTAAGSTLVVADGARGLALFALPAQPHRHRAEDSQQHPIEPARSGFVDLPGPIAAMAADDDRVVVASADGTLVVIEGFASGPRPTRQRRIALGAPASAVALSSGRLYALAAAGLVRIDLEDDGPFEPVRIASRVASLSGVALAVAGREVTVLSKEGTLSRIVDRDPAAMLHSVSVLNNFFSPQTLAILPGDSVRWSNSMGFHNVFSCTDTQDGCTVASTESFTSGNVGSLWSFTYEFTQPGDDPYVCQPHAPFMTGMVEVLAPAPPPVPDGRVGAPMTVTPGPGGLSIAWDEVSCGAAGSYHLIWGQRGDLPAMAGGAFQGLGGSVCAIASPFLWSGSPDPASFPGRILWWLILPAEGTTEGSWGLDAQGVERVGPGADGSSGACGVLSRDVSAVCHQQK